MSEDRSEDGPESTRPPLSSSSQLLLPPPPDSPDEGAKLEAFRAPHETPAPDSLEPTITVPPPPPLPVDTSLLRRVSRSIAPYARRSLAPIRNTFAPFAPYARRTWEPLRRTIAPWVPRWKPWSPQRVLAVTAAFAAAMGLAILIAPKQVRSFFNRVVAVGRPAPVEAAPAVEPAGEPKQRADANLQRKGRSPIAGAIMALPPSFSSEDGAYDVAIHFHGNTDLVEESFELARINAALVLVNIGIGSGPYEDRFSNPDVLAETLARVKGALAKRGLENPKQRRLALTAWSAGYGAVVRIIENPALAESVDSIILLDGIHASLINGTDIDPLRMAPFERFARKAMGGDKLFVITHSEIKPLEYAGTERTTDALLKMVGVLRTEGGDVPGMPAFTASHGVPKSKLLVLKPKSEARAGGLRVRGYTGETPEHHMAHLIQMASIGLADLAERWNSEPPK